MPAAKWRSIDGDVRWRVCHEQGTFRLRHALNCLVIVLTTLASQPLASNGSLAGRAAQSAGSKARTASSSEGSFTLDAVGDVLFARRIERKILARGESYPFRSITPALRSADAVIGNLETALSDRPFTVVQQYRFRAAPSRARLLREAGFTLVNVANNHAMDCGSAGLQDTLNALAAQHIAATGVDRGASTPLVEKVGGLRIGFVSFCDFRPVGKAAEYPTICYASEESVRSLVSEARSRSDVVIASFHWGQEESDQVSARQRRLAQVAADAGSDLILGHHPHVLQGIAALPARNRYVPVAYSLGNFLFDGHKSAEKQTIILRCRIGRSGVASVEALPVTIDRSAPRPATARDGAAILRHVAALSRALGAHFAGSHLIIPMRSLCLDLQAAFDHAFKARRYAEEIDSAGESPAP